MECSKGDWKLFRNRIAEWQENYMGQLVKEYIQLLSGSENASEKFYDIVALINYGVITEEDLDGFSDDLKEKVNFFLKR